MNTTNPKDKLKAIRESINKALAAVVAEHGLRSLHAGNVTFSPEGSFVFKVEGVAAGGATKEEELYDLAREVHPELPARGTPQSTIRYNGGPCELFGANSTLTKIFIRRPDGKTYQAPAALILAAVKAQS